MCMTFLKFILKFSVLQFVKIKKMFWVMDVIGLSCSPKNICRPVFSDLTLYLKHSKIYTSMVNLALILKIMGGLQLFAVISFSKKYSIFLQKGVIWIESLFCWSKITRMVSNDHFLLFEGEKIYSMIFSCLLMIWTTNFIQPIAKIHFKSKLPTKH